MSETISRLPAVTPSYPVKPTQPANKEDRRKPPRGGPGRERSRDTEGDESPDGGADESPKIDEYI